MKIDMFAHICPKPFIDAFSKRVTSWEKLSSTTQEAGWPMIWDIDKRLEVMEKYEDYVQVLVPTGQALETICGPKDAAYLASIFNDAMAELVCKYPDKFVGAVACLPLNNIDATLLEIDRTINELGFKGILLNTPVYMHSINQNNNNSYIKPIDLPEFMPIYEKMAGIDLPIWIHPRGQGGVPVYSGEERGKFGFSHVFGWPIESAMAMGRLVCSGILGKHPNIKFIIHHCGSGIVPALAGRIEVAFEKFKLLGMDLGHFSDEDPFGNKPAIDYFRMFYADTALDGDMEGLMSGYNFFGVSQMLFGTDFPYDLENGDRYIRTVIDAVYRMRISDIDKEKIFSGNAKKIMCLD